MNPLYSYGLILLGVFVSIETLICLVGYIILGRKFGRFISKNSYEKQLFIESLLEEKRDVSVYKRDGFRKIMKERISWKR